MMRLVRRLTWALLRFFVWLRYRVTVRGLREAASRPGPFLVMPSHPAYSDPVCVLVSLWPHFELRPMLLETNFQNPVLAPFAFLLRAIRVPDTDRASGEARQRAEGAVAAAVAVLKAGENVVLWPSGRLQRDGTERLGGARAAADILAAVPNATAVLVRSRGLWGSSFSWAFGHKPDLAGGMLRAAGAVLANLLAFTPRRRVTQTLQAFGPGERPAPTREAVNRWLEAWYNAEGPEPPTYVPYHPRYGPRTFAFPAPKGEARELDLSAVRPETKAAVAQALEEKLKRPLSPEENRPETPILELGLDSLERMEVSLVLEQRFGTSGDHVPITVGELWALSEGKLSAGEAKTAPPEWFAPPSDGGPLEILGETIPAAFVRRVVRHPKDAAAADDVAGTITYEKLLVGAWAMARRFRGIAAPNVGLLLPSVVAADLSFFALHLAGKLPVVLNWTTGPANLGHAARLMGLTHVVTSKAFIDRTQVEVAGTRYLYLEDVRAGMGRFELLRRLLAVRLLPGRVEARLLGRLSADPSRPAVVLFTSGSEKAPKAVPLSHANVIADQRGAIACLRLRRSDSSGMGFLPMFHSFGLTITGLLPLLTGVRVVRHPDPTDAGGIVRKVAGYRPSLVAGTPAFLSQILDRAKPGDLDSLRLVVVGAEKCPDSLFDKAAMLAPRAEVLEGYGITECSPVVAVNVPGAIRRGTVGPPLPGVDVSVRHLETNAPLPQGEMGMLHVAGPTVFAGYVGADAPPPFLEADGKRWYVAGDLASIDEAGYVVFRGRLKRFLKAGGEMISLPALEEPFAHLYPPTDDGPRVAVEGIETPEGRRIVLFTTEEVALRDANAALQREGFRGVMRIDEVKRLDRLPVLGTGKTDYKVLRGLIAEG